MALIADSARLGEGASPPEPSPRARPLFPSFFLGGFECSTHRRRDGRRLDLIAATGHDRFAREDYARLRSVGILAARDGIRWHSIESHEGRYDWAGVVPMLRAARETGVLVIWDLLHFGWPDGMDVFSARFVERFRRFAREFARVLGSETDQAPFVAPVNEISFLSYAGGEEGFFNPFARHRGDELKAQLVRACLAASDAVREVLPASRLVASEPIIDIIADPKRPQDRMAAEAYRQSQFAAWDMIAGRARPELGGQESLLDVLGANYYIQNQWIHNGPVLVPSHPEHLPVRYLLREVFERYRRPLFIAETGTEAGARPSWLRYIAREARCARLLGVSVEGLCLYPIVDHPGWEDDRHCPNGLWEYPDASGERAIYEPLATELRLQEALLAPPPGDTREPECDAETLDLSDLRLLDLAAQEIGEATETSRKS